MKYILAIFLAPIASLIYGNTKDFIITMFLSFLLYIPGIIYALKVVKNTED
ncbi:MAG: YqaE/Pmp3 family membrane protein [Candidatus Woesearchaeota archaeon]